MLRSSTINANNKKSPQVEGYFGSSVGFISGFLNASFGDASPNSHICQTNITRIMDYSVAFVDQVKNPTAEELEKAAFSAENVLASIHPITYSCFTSAFEIGEAADYYVDSFADIKMIAYNIVHSLGNIYDTIYFLIKHQ